MFTKLLRKPAVFRRLFNLYPPFVGAGIYVKHIAADWRSLEVRLKHRFYNSNYVGTHFGGSLFSMCDAIYMILFSNVLGPRYLVWDQRAAIEFVKPGRGTVRAHFTIDDETLAAVKAATASGQKHLRELCVEIVDERGEVVARVSKTLYFRLKRRHRPKQVQEQEHSSEAQG